MAINDSTLSNDTSTTIHAIDELNHAYSMIEFLQDVLTLQPGGVMPESLSTTGMYYVMQDIKDRMSGATLILDNARKAPINDDVKVFKTDLYSMVDAKFSILLFTLAGLREEAKSSEITTGDIGKFESLVSDSRFEITNMLEH